VKEKVRTIKRSLHGRECVYTVCSLLYLDLCVFTSLGVFQYVGLSSVLLALVSLVGKQIVGSVPVAGSLGQH